MTLLRTFIDVPAGTHFPIQNLPYGIFTHTHTPRLGTRIGDYVLDLSQLAQASLLDHPHLPDPATLFAQPSLNALMALGRPAWQALRTRLQHLLNAHTPTLRDNAPLRQQALIPLEAVTMHLPATVGDYTDFYSSRNHAINVGTMFRGAENALMPNWLHIPIAYHGRASSLIPSGVDIRRPHGQTKPPTATSPIFGPSQSLDFELEMGFFVGPGNPLGQPIPIDQATDHIFGMVLVNDWSARDIQAWEYRPLGPFLAKNFATSISPWVVTLDALEPFRLARPPQDPQPLPYLQGAANDWYDIQLEVQLQSEQMAEPMTISQSNFKHMYWSMAQQLAHHTITGCNTRPGDLLASGTISGTTPDSYGSLLEITWRGTKPLTLPTGETRRFLNDHDRITLTGWCQANNYRIGFGQLTTKLLMANG